MTYNSGCGSSQGPPFFDSMSNSQFFPQEDPLDSQNSWMENIDPELRSPSRNQNESPYSLLAWQRQPIDRFVFEPERDFSMQHHLQDFPHGLNKQHTPISSIPQAPRVRMTSPGSSHELTSSCSSARSPGPEAEWYNPQYSPQAQARDDFSVPNATSYVLQGFPDPWSGSPPSHLFSQTVGYQCINLSQVQGIPDISPQEVTYEADEGYAAIESKAEYAMQMDSRSIKVESYPTDEGLGRSIKSGSPTESTSARHDIDANSEMDADGDEEEIDPDTIVAEAPSDTEYSPRSTRTRKRRPSKTLSSPPNKRSRIIKAAPKGKGQFSCKSCEHAPFKDTGALQRHIATSHTRAFICVFEFAGCQSTFASKNEWKRHVSSQHLNLSAWVCELGACGKAGKGGGKGSSEFNRKDLFTQHLRRMHAPFSVKRQNKKNTEWEEKLKEWQVSCLRVKRNPPTQLACPVEDCENMFEGATCWDERMEHVGKHLEKAATTTGVNKLVVEQGDDELLVGWALREGIIESGPGGGFRLHVNNGARVASDDIDAEGEEDI